MNSLFYAACLWLIAAAALNGQTYVTPGLTSTIENPSDLVLQSFQFTDTVQPDSRVLVEISADLENSRTGEWREAEVTLSVPDSGLDFEVTDSSLEFGAAAGTTTVSPTGTNSSMAAVVAAGDLAAFKANIEAGDYLTITGAEFFVFAAEPRAVDKTSAELWLSASNSVHVFSGMTDLIDSLTPGQILVEDSTIHNLPLPRTKNPLDPLVPDPPKVLVEFLPFEVASVVEVNGEVHVTGEKRELLEVLKSATIEQVADDAVPGLRSYYDPPVESTLTNAEREKNEELALMLEVVDPLDIRLPLLRGFYATPVKFSDIEITPMVHLSGQVLLRSSGLNVQIQIRDFALQRIALKLSGGVALNAVLEIGEPEDTTTIPDEEKSFEIAKIPLPPVIISIAGVPIEFLPVFTVTVGADVVAPSKLTIPVQSAICQTQSHRGDSIRDHQSSDGISRLHAAWPGESERGMESGVLELQPEAIAPTKTRLKGEIGRMGHQHWPCGGKTKPSFEGRPSIPG